MLHLWIPEQIITTSIIVSIVQSCSVKKIWLHFIRVHVGTLNDLRANTITTESLHIAAGSEKAIIFEYQGCWIHNTGLSKNALSKFMSFFLVLLTVLKVITLFFQVGHVNDAYYED